MTDTPPAAPCKPRRARSDLAAALKVGAPYVLAIAVLLEVSSTQKPSDLFVHVIDLLLGAALMAINPAAHKPGAGEP